MCTRTEFVKKKSSLASGFQLLIGQVKRLMNKKVFTFNFILQTLPQKELLAFILEILDHDLLNLKISRRNRENILEDLFWLYCLEQKKSYYALDGV